MRQTIGSNHSGTELHDFLDIALVHAKVNRSGR